MMKSKLHTLAAIAAIFAAIIAGVEYFSPRNGVSFPSIPQSLRDSVNNISIDTSKAIYHNQLSWLFVKYRAANAIPYAEDKSNALRNVMEQAISVGDYNMAILAAIDIPYSQSKSDALYFVVQKTISDSSNFAYSVIAAENIPYSEAKKNALMLIISAKKK